MIHEKIFLRGSLLVLLAATFAAGAPAWADTKVKVSADQLQLDDKSSGTAAKAEGHVTIEIPGQVLIHAPSAQLIKGADGQLARAIFPGWVQIQDLRPNKPGQWDSEKNTGGVYDFKTGEFTETNTNGVFELSPGTAAKAHAG